MIKLRNSYFALAVVFGSFFVCPNASNSFFFFGGDEENLSTDEDVRVSDFLGVESEYEREINSIEEMNMDLEIRLQQQQFENERLKEKLNHAMQNKTIYNEDLRFAKKPTVVCRDFNCSRVNSKTTSEFLYSNLFKMFYYNKHSNISICEADPNNRSCLTSGIKVAADVGAGTPVVFDLMSATIYGLDHDKQFKSLEFALQPNLLANGIKTKCTAYNNRIEVRGSNSIVVVGGNYYCDLNSSRNVIGNMIYNIDYIDLDYNLIGAYYTFNFEGGANAGKTGYLLMKFPEGNKVVVEKEKSDTTKDGGEYVVPGRYKVIPISTEKKELFKESSFSKEIKGGTITSSSFKRVKEVRSEDLEAGTPGARRE